MTNSKPENAIMNPKGIIPNKKKSIPEAIILYVKPLNIFKSIWPDKILAANLKPKEIFLARYEINSINTNKGNKLKGQPAGTNNEKNAKPCCWNPNIVAPKTIVKLIEKVNRKCEVDAKLYGIIPIRLFIKIKINNV